ncbi:MAG: divergent polysaccharide deacetylase family protein [Alphaproteobacteria bacterium]|nr:MAG: divergent polysaccharide deacetylase family protein [Alphaproteobacteria bacterium]
MTGRTVKGRATRSRAGRGRLPRAGLSVALAAVLLVLFAAFGMILLRHESGPGAVRKRPSPSASTPLAVTVPPPPVSPKMGPRPRIAIVIDDLGIDRQATERAIRLPAAVTLAFLPYAHDVAGQAKRAATHGHELLVHLPMEPVGSADPGPMALYRDLNDAEFRQRLAWNLSRFSGFVGINNHMGSAYTADVPAMRRLMRALASRKLMFLDSRTTKLTRAEMTAAGVGVRFARRSVFLDHERGAAAVRAALHRLERRARRNGAAIAIGHPHRHTLAALEAWLPDLERRGFVLVPVSSLAQRPAAIAKRSRGWKLAPARP